ncbi:MAG TPA: alkaline phosphatase family protein [Gaiellaceae bacterium]
MLAVFQFDAVSVPLVQRLLDEGRLPTLAGLRSRGRWLDLETPATHFPAAAYFTLYSGVRVADHGMYHLFQWSPDQQRVLWREEFPSPVTVWERMAGSGKKALVVDAYESTPPRSLSGVALSGWQFVNILSLHRWSYPDSAHSELARLFGRPRRLEEVFGKPSARGLVKLRRHLFEATNRLVEGTLHLLRRDSFDLVWVAFLASHLGGHMLWDLSQIDAERLDQRARTALEHALTDIYEDVDRGLGRLIAALPEDADVIVTAPSGMGENMIRVDLLPGMLEAVLSGNGAARGNGAQSRGERFIWRLRAAVPASARAKVSAALPGTLSRELTMRLTSVGVDWSKTPAFLLPSDHFGQVRFNVRGRERDGIVDPAQVDDLACQLQVGLSSFRDPDGRPAVVSVDRTQDVVGEGKRVGLLPDLVVRWREGDASHIDHVSSPEHGVVVRHGSGTGRSGAHLPQAWAVVVPQASVEVRNDSPSIGDLVPTACAVLDIEAADLPGSPLLARR